MAGKKLTQNQKIDLILETVTVLKSDVSTLKSDVFTLKSNVSDLQASNKRIETEISHLIEMSSKALLFGAQAIDRLDDIDSKLPKKSFTPFTSGAFAA